MILGLDISTNCTGWAISTDQGHIINFDHIDTSDLKCIFESTSYQWENIKEIIKNSSITKVRIEDPLTKFQRGKSSASTIQKLTQINFTLSWLIYNEFGIKPKYFRKSTARKNIGIKKTKKDTEKDVALQWCLENVNGFVELHGPRGGFLKATYDRSDAIIMALAGANES